MSLADYTFLHSLRAQQLSYQPQIFLARSKIDDALVVIKWLNQNAPLDQQKIFAHEVLVLNHLSNCCHHGHWLPIIETGQDVLLLDESQQQDLISYVVMPYVVSGSLKKAIQIKNYKLDDIKAIILRLIDAVDTLHQCGWLHLDLKPSNILLKDNSATHEVILIDFALAQQINTPCTNHKTDQGIHTATLKITQGTPKYMSPEQFLAQDLNHQTDYYALGLILYELITGQAPFCIGNDQTGFSGQLPIDHYQHWAFQHCQQAVPLLPHQFACIQDLLDGLLAKDRQNRVQTILQIKQLAYSSF